MPSQFPSVRLVLILRIVFHTISHPNMCPSATRGVSAQLVLSRPSFHTDPNHPAPPTSSHIIPAHPSGPVAAHGRRVLPPVRMMYVPRPRHHPMLTPSDMDEPATTPTPPRANRDQPLLHERPIQHTHASTIQSTAPICTPDPSSTLSRTRCAQAIERRRRCRLRARKRQTHPHTAAQRRPHRSPRYVRQPPRRCEV